MTHSELVEKAEKWLKNYLHCRVVLSEHKAYTKYGEIPDCIGWVRGYSVVVECKVSHSDLTKDRIKKCRKGGMGDYRFYLSLSGLIKTEEIPSGWGLYEIHGEKIEYVGGIKYSNCSKSPFLGDKRSEVAMLVSVLTKINTGGEIIDKSKIQR